MKKNLEKKNRIADQTTALLVLKLKKEDSIELPMDEKFFDLMHSRIMSAVEQTEVKPLNRWSKTWVFLEAKAKPYRTLAKKVIKTSFVGFAFIVALGLAHFSLKFVNDLNQSKLTASRQSIIQEAKQDPTQWTELVANYQNENDFYADVLSRREDLGTLVQIDRVLIESL